MTRMRLRVGVVGASGYSGLELLRLLHGHPNVEVTYAAGNHDGEVGLADEYPFLPGSLSLRLIKHNADECARLCDAAFVALPSGTSGHVAAELWKRGLPVIDLSGDLRLPADLYESWYRKTPVGPEVVSAAVYGLTEWNREAVRSARLIANPGCYATSALLGLLPVVRAGLHKEGAPIVIDAKSGVSGAGRSAAIHTQFAELTDNFYPYRVGRHQHIPEIERTLFGDGMDGGAQGRIVFTTQLLPAVRGIYACCYVPLCDAVSVDEVYECYREKYEREPFVRVLPQGRVPELKHVRGSNLCLISLYVDQRTNTLQVFSVLDNLQKGAAGQALQNLNLMFGFDETAGLQDAPLYP